MTDEKEKKPKYPRKLWFGLTDYGPPPMTWAMVLAIAATALAVAFVRVYFRHEGQVIGLGPWRFVTWLRMRQLGQGGLKQPPRLGAVEASLLPPQS